MTIPYVTTEVENIIRDWCQTIIGVPVYFKDSNVTRPSGLYADLLIMGALSEGTPTENYVDTEVSGEPWTTHEVYDPQIITVSVNAYRAGARDAMKKFKSGRWLNLAYEILDNANLALMDIGDMLNITQVVEGQQEERAQMMLTIRLVDYAEELLNTIDQVQVDYNNS